VVAYLLPCVGVAPYAMAPCVLAQQTLFMMISSLEELIADIPDYKWCVWNFRTGM
jgi:hypothetical protein